jgi:hypothetical protein
MKRLERWLDRQARRQLRRPRLADALLTRRAWSYVAYRLRWVTLRVALRAALHLAEVILLARMFLPEFVIPILILRSAATWVGSLWWGALEQLRADVREQARRRAWTEVRHTIDVWLRMGVAFGLLCAGASATYVEFGPTPRGWFSVFDAYAVALGIRVALDGLTRVYHSGRYALARVYRPPWTLVLPDLLDVVGIVLLWESLGLWGFSVTLVAVGALRAGFTLYFTRRSYAVSPIPPLVLKALWRGRRWPGGRELLGAARHALANATAQIDALLVVVLLAAHPNHGGFVPLALLLYVLRPLLAAGNSWARIFYFDFKTLQLRSPTLLQRRFARLLYRVAWSYSLLLVAVVLGLGYWLTGGRVHWSLLLLVPLFVLRSLFALYQVQGFSLGQHAYLLKLTLGVGLGMFVVSRLPQTEVHVLVGVIAVLAVAVFVGGPPDIEPVDRGGGGVARLGVPAWLAALARVPGPVRVCAAVVNTRVGRARHVAEAVSTTIRTGALTRWGQTHLLWFDAEPAADEEAAEPSTDLWDLPVVRAAGCLRSLRCAGVQPDGRAALKAAAECDLWPRALARHLEGPESRGDPAALLSEFRERFAQGTVLDIGHGVLPGTRKPRAFGQLRDILREVAAQTSFAPRRGRASGGFDVTAYCPGGEPELVFLVSTETARQERAEWRQRVEALSLRASIAAE